MLTAVLCLLLFDDEHLSRLREGVWRRAPERLPTGRRGREDSERTKKAVTTAIVALLVLNSFVLVGFLFLFPHVPVSPPLSRP